MKLYHGSNVIVVEPRILEKLRSLDFGRGFYLTSNKVQAQKWAKTVARRRGHGKSIINVYNINNENLEKIKVLKFDTANEEWLDFVVHNRKNILKDNSYDLVIGPVANDATLPVIDDYIDGRYTKEEAVRRLLPQNLTDQYAFLTNAALEILHFERSEEV